MLGGVAIGGALDVGGVVSIMNDASLVVTALCLNIGTGIVFLGLWMARVLWRREPQI